MICLGFGWKLGGLEVMIDWTEKVNGIVIGIVVEVMINDRV